VPLAGSQQAQQRDPLRRDLVLAIAELFQRFFKPDLGSAIVV
jgi:hypothetical protein